MKEKIVDRDGEKVTEVRSDGGKLLFIKTKKGYEMKCPRTKQICLVKYEEMFQDCLQCLDHNRVSQNEDLLSYLKKSKKK